MFDIEIFRLKVINMSVEITCKGHDPAVLKGSFS